MPLINDIKHDIKNDISAASKIRLPWWLILVLIVVSVPIYWLFDHADSLRLGLPTVISVGVVGFTMMVKWRMRHAVWFWITITVLAAVHVPLILFVPWTTKWVPAPAIAAVASADFIVMLVIIDVVARFMKQTVVRDQRTGGNY
jgi:hypothetical protein